MTADEPIENVEGGGRERIRWPPYMPRERELLERKFLGDWENLDFMSVFWNPIWDQRDVAQYRRLAQAWRLRHQGRSFKDISKELAVDTGKACALVSGKNLRPYLASMYLNGGMLAEPGTDGSGPSRRRQSRRTRIRQPTEFLRQSANTATSWSS